MQNSKCVSSKVQSAKCKVQNAKGKGKMQNAKVQMEKLFFFVIFKRFLKRDRIHLVKRKKAKFCGWRYAKNLSYFNGYSSER